MIVSSIGYGFVSRAGAGHYERTPERRGYANGTRPKKIDTPAGTIEALERGTALLPRCHAGRGGDDIKGSCDEFRVSCE